jgi:hypothetical protein
MSVASPTLSASGRAAPAWTWMAALGFLVAANIAFQLFWHRHGLTNEILTVRHPTAHDATEYVRAAKAVAEKGAFDEAFGEGGRMPGYSLFLSLFFRAAGEPLRAVRFAQIFLSASIIALFFGLLARLTGSRRRALIGSAAAAAWLPLYHYSPAILAESVSLWLIVLLPFVLAMPASPSLSAARAAGLGIIAAALVYMKPNHLLLLAPVAGFLLIAEGKKTGARSAAIAIAVACALLAPWSAFVSGKAGRFVPLTLLSGYNLRLGTGAFPFVQDSTALPYRVARATGLAGAGPAGEAGVPGTGDGAPLSPVSPASPATRDALYAREARDIWVKHPVAATAHGMAKVLHGFGFSFRGKRDVFLACFFAAALWASFRLWRRGARHGTPAAGFNPRAWVCYFWLCTLVIAWQMFLYLPNQRFKTVLFDPPALLMLVLAASKLRDERRQGRRGPSP